jgi:hypothetical protein
VNHEMTLDVNPSVVAVRCSCGVTVFSLPRRLGGMVSVSTQIPWNDLSLAVAQHLQPEIDGMVRELLRKISVRDIIREILRRRG